MLRMVVAKSLVRQGSKSRCNFVYINLKPSTMFSIDKCFLSNQIPKSNKGNQNTSVPATQKVVVALKNGVQYIAESTLDILKNPRATWQMIKDTAHHYWYGSKLLWTEIKMAYEIVKRILQGHVMTRRERLQLIRTTMDIFRLVPFAIFVIVPFMEFLLPFALKLFPNMLPSTFQDELKKEESLKKELQMRLAVAGFLQETLQGMAAKRASSTEANEVIKFIEQARKGEPLPNDLVIRMSKLFKDEFTLANIQRPQLVSMCQYMGIHPYGNDTFLRFQLRNKFRIINEDDRRILWEGIDSLSIDELKDACQVRGMQAHGLPSWRYSKQLKEWLDLSIQKNIPISLLIMSRTFTITQSTGGDSLKNTEEVLKSSISSMDADTINEIVLAAASPAEEDTVEIRKRKLESLQFQKEMIEDEREELEESEETKAQTKSSQTKQRLIEKEKKRLESGSPATEEVTGLNTESISPTHTHSEELSSSEIEAISDLSTSSAVQKEKAKLAILQANIDAVQSSSKESIGGPNGLEKEEEHVKVPLSDADKAASNLTVLLSSMVNKLKTKIDTTEKVLGNTFHRLDLDGDGVINAQELKEAIKKHLKRSSTENAKDVEEIAEDLFKNVDTNSDGKISIVELLKFAEQKRKSEIE